MSRASLQGRAGHLAERPRGRGAAGRNFIARRNIRRFSLMLKTERDPEIRAQIERLLSQAVADLDVAERGAPSEIHPSLRRL